MRKHTPLTGKYGNWTILGPTQKHNNKIYYLCKCVCGKEEYKDAYSLRTGKSKSCGCKRNLGTGIDITGQKFGHLVALERVFVNNHAMWNCKCDCGATKIVPTNNLTAGYVTTCGCRMGQGEATRESISKYCVDGTYLPGVTRTHLNKNNTSGVTGVGFDYSRNRWKAAIKFQGKQIFLGRFLTKEEAIEARQIAEKEYFGKYRKED